MEKTTKELNKKIGDNIKWALKRSALSQRQVSELLGISRQTLSNYISGSTPIDADKLLNIALLTGKSIDYFYSDKSTGLSANKSALSSIASANLVSLSLFESYVFRSDILIPETVKYKFEQKVKQYVEIERINEISPYQFKIDSALHKFDKPHIELIAQKIRGLFEIGPATPISNPVYELERNNVKIIQFPEDDQDISGFSAYNDELGYCIYLNSKCTIERRFFTSAHELAHLIFHKKDYVQKVQKNYIGNQNSDLSLCSNDGINRNGLSNEISETGDGLSGINISELNSGGLNIVNKDKIKEDIADEFAGLFLVPSASLASFCKNNFIEDFSFENVIILKKYFNVSAKCMIRRLLKEGFITKKHHNDLNAETDEKIDPYHEYEPIERSRIVENHRFINLVKRALLNKKISESEAAAYLRSP